MQMTYSGGGNRNPSLNLSRGVIANERVLVFVLFITFILIKLEAKKCPCHFAELNKMDVVVNVAVE
jgi:hypothetical protein